MTKIDEIIEVYSSVDSDDIHPDVMETWETGTERELVQLLMDKACHIAPLVADEEQRDLNIQYSQITRRVLIERFGYDS